MSIDQDRLTPALRQKVRRLEVTAAMLAGLLLVGTVLAHTLGVVGATSGDGELSVRRFRPLVADFRGDVSYWPVGGADWRPLRWSDSFEAGDRLRVGDGAFCDVLLTWGTGFHLGAGSEITWLVCRSVEEAREIELRLLSGKVTASLDRFPIGSRFEVVTRHSRTRVKGTTLSVAVGDEQTDVNVLNGVVEVVDTSNPDRKVEARAGTKVTSRGGGDVGELRPLTALERAKLLTELSSVDERLARLSPDAPSEEELAEAVPTKATEPEEDTEDLRAAKGTQASALEEIAAVRDLLLAGFEYLNGGSAGQALGLCTPEFRGLIWGPSARRLGVPVEYRRRDGDAKGLQLQARIQDTADLRIEVLKIEVVLDGDVAYGSATVVAILTQGGGSMARRGYACTVRCLKQNGRWLVDLATATEGARRK
jgi:hypothetical protein